MNGERVKVFWLAPLDLVEVRLRVYRWEQGLPCVARTSSGLECCDAGVEIIAQAPRSAWLEDFEDGTHRTRAELVGEDDPRWPISCDACGIPFDVESKAVRRQVWAEQLYRGAPDGRAVTIRNAPVGAMWHADWLADRAGGQFTGPDGLAVMVRTPGGDWTVDGEASNCDRTQLVPVEGQPGTRHFVRSHYCWVRHGDPRTGELHVDKNGNTCAAGAGSIVIGGYHGFLHHGYLVPC